MLTLKPQQCLSEVIEVRPVGPDDMSDIRYIHATAFRRQAGSYLTDDEISAFTQLVYSNGYLDKIDREDLHAARLGRELIATGGWTAVDNSSTRARLRSIFVVPLFAGLGIGRRMVREAEARARYAGFKEFSVRAPVNAVRFFERLGYEVRSHGVHVLPSAHDIPVRFMSRSLANERAVAAGIAAARDTVDDAGSTAP